jgi:microcompartment protein CcmK/EutM
MLPVLGHIPIDGIDEFAGNEDTVEGSNDDHEFITGWMDGGFRDIQGRLDHLKIDMQEALSGSRVIVSYQLDDDENETSNPWVLVGAAGAGSGDGVVSARGSTTLQFDTDGDNNGIEFRTVRFKFNFTRIQAALLAGAIVTTNAVAIPIDAGHNLPSSGLIQVEDEVIEYASIAADTISATGQTRGARGTDAATHIDDSKVYSLNRTPEMRAATLVYAKKAPLRQTWVGEIDVNKMVEQSASRLIDTNDDGTPDTAATHQNVYNFLKTIRDKQTLVKLVIPEKETSVMVQLADYTVVSDDYRDSETVRDTIPVTFLEPVKA